VVYERIKSSSSGNSFLAGNNLLTLRDGALTLQYQAGQKNYRCPACARTFEHAAALTQHIANRPQCMASGLLAHLQIGYIPPQQWQPQKLKFFHGTTWAFANEIQRNGFKVSEYGLLGRGVYCAQEDKARKFAIDRAKRAGEPEGGMVELLAMVRNPSYKIIICLPR